jgi:hypothetical protein
MKYSERLYRVLLVFFLIFLIGCASYQRKVEKGRGLIEQRQFSLAAEELRPLANKPNDDQLVYLLDYATSLQLAGEYKKSNRAFIVADQISEEKDYHSLSRVTGSMLLSEGMVQYKGDPFEKVIINAMTAINFLMLGQHDSALIEAKKINTKLLKYETDGKKRYDQNAMAYYLSAMIWEAQGKWDDAYIDYKKVYKLDPSISLLKKDLIRLAKKSQRMKDYKKWKKAFPKVKEQNSWYDSTLGEVVFIYQQGWGPRKRIRPENHRYPMLSRVRSFTQSASFELEGAAKGESQFIYSVQDVAIKTLDGDYAALVARRVGGVVAKAVMSDQIRQKNKVLGDLAWIAMNIADRADLRHWSTLPESFQLVRLRVKPGKYKAYVKGLSSRGMPTGESAEFHNIEVKPGKMVFLNWRSVE